MNLFDQILEQTSKVNYAARAKALRPYINVLDIFNNCGSNSLIVKAECGVGKTYSLRPLVKDLHQKVLYVSHRLALNAENAEYFTDTTCINSLFARTLDGYDYIVFDEWTAMSSGFDWDALNLESILKAIQTYTGNLIFIDRDCSEQSVKEIEDFAGRDNFVYHEHQTGSREKVVLFTKDINEFINQVKQYYGIKIICTDNARKAEQLANKDWGCPARAITARTTKVYSVEQTIEWARQQHNCVIITSPKVQEGTSFTGTDFVFNGYIWYHTSDIKLPANKIYQACMRCRDEGAVRVVCFQASKINYLDDVDADELYEEYLEKIQKNREYSKLLRKQINALKSQDNVREQELQKQLDEFNAKYRSVFYNIYASRITQTNLQLKNMVKATQQEFELGGFTVDISSNKACMRANFDKQVKPDDSNKIKIEVSPERAEFLQKLIASGKCTGSTWVNQDEMLKSGQPINPKDAEFVPHNNFVYDLADQLDKWSKQDLMNNVWRSKQTQFISGKFDDLVNEQNLLSIHRDEKEKLMLYFEILSNVTNLVLYASGSDVSFTRKALESNNAFVKFKQLTNNTDAKTNKFFTKYGKDNLGFTFSSKRGGNTKYIIHNDKDLTFSNDDLRLLYLHQRNLHSDENYKEAIAYLES